MALNTQSSNDNCIVLESDGSDSDVAIESDDEDDDDVVFLSAEPGSSKTDEDIIVLSEKRSSSTKTVISKVSNADRNSFQIHGEINVENSGCASSESDSLLSVHSPDVGIPGRSTGVDKKDAKKGNDMDGLKVTPMPDLNTFDPGVSYSRQPGSASDFLLELEPDSDNHKVGHQSLITPTSMPEAMSPSNLIKPESKGNLFDNLEESSWSSISDVSQDKDIASLESSYSCKSEAADRTDCSLQRVANSSQKLKLKRLHFASNVHQGDSDIPDLGKHKDETEDKLINSRTNSCSGGVLSSDIFLSDLGPLGTSASLSQATPLNLSCSSDSGYLPDLDRTDHDKQSSLLDKFKEEQESTKSIKLKLKLSKNSWTVDSNNEPSRLKKPVTDSSHKLNQINATSAGDDLGLAYDNSSSLGAASHSDSDVILKNIVTSDMITNAGCSAASASTSDDVQGIVDLVSDAVSCASNSDKFGSAKEASDYKSKLIKTARDGSIIDPFIGTTCAQGSSGTQDVKSAESVTVNTEKASDNKQHCKRHLSQDESPTKDSAVSTYQVVPLKKRHRTFSSSSTSVKDANSRMCDVLAVAPCTSSTAHLSSAPSSQQSVHTSGCVPSSEFSATSLVSGVVAAYKAAVTSVPLQRSTSIPASSSSVTQATLLSAGHRSTSVPTSSAMISQRVIEHVQVMKRTKRSSSCAAPLSSSIPSSSRGTLGHAPEGSSASSATHSEGNHPSLFPNETLPSSRTTHCRAATKYDPQPCTSNQDKKEKCIECWNVGLCSDMSFCTKGHPCCKKCLQERVKTLLTKSNKGSLECSHPVCESFFTISELRRSLPGMVVDILEDKLYNECTDLISDLACKYLDEEDQKKNSSRDAAAQKKPDNGLPPHWDEMNPGSTFQLVTLSENSVEYLQVCLLFHNTMVWPRAQIQSIQRVQNPILWQFFTVKKEQMSRENDGQIAERQLFHGTKRKLIDSICKNNFDWRVCGMNGTMYGQGSYFARDAAYSHVYTDRPGDRPVGLRGISLYSSILSLQRHVHPSLPTFQCVSAPTPSTSTGANSSSTPNKLHTHVMFLAKVLVGQYTRGNQMVRKPPPFYDQDPYGKSFDSCVDNVLDPRIFVIFDSAQCYPEYVIHYTNELRAPQFV